ncbi:MAG TPA: aminotransferase class V-fold PLP-dependent enzyme [Actinomycetota bacterium]|nr:aminotransferase class V-fold PLP-dependent enzyme [Actinomycetota bacterium]
MTVDFESYRDEFPVLKRKAYLISASLGPVSRRAQTYLQEYIDAWATKGAPDHVWMEDIFPRMRNLKRTFGTLVGADPAELAITVNVSLAVSAVLSCVDFGKRKKIVLSELDFPTNGHVALAYRRRGAEVVFLRSPDGLTIPVDAYRDAIDEDTALVLINRVLYRSSALLDAKEVCRLAREAGAWSMVDDFHGAGVIPVDVHDLGCDFYTTGVLKWLCGGPGLTFLYARRDLVADLEPLVTGWFATNEPFSFDLQHLDYHPTARRLEHGTPAAPVSFIAQGGLDIITEVGPAAIRERQQDLVEHVIGRADEAGLPIRSPRDRQGRGGIVNVGVGPEAAKVCHALLDRDICTDYRGDGIRVSPHFFNTEEDVDRLFEGLREIL